MTKLVRVLIYTHRWLGIAGCIVFLVWFVSGVVMMYERMPRLSGEERLARLAPVDLSAIQATLADAAAALLVAPERLRIGTLGGRPVYRFLADGYWTTAYADTGEPFSGLDRDAAVEIARRFLPEHAATARYDAYLRRPDQWTIDAGLPRFLPLHRIRFGDPERTVLYVSDRTGEPVMKTTARGRFWGYLGAVLHWTYFTPFRLQAGLWRDTIIYAALIGCLLCLSGLVLGIWRFSPSARFRLKRVPSHSPYAGMMHWHHYAGLLFGLFSFTWALSGALSLTPWDWAPPASPTAQQADAVRGGALRLDRITLPRIRAAAAVLEASFTPKEYEVLQFRGEPFLMAFRPPTVAEAARAVSFDGRAFQSPQLPLDHRLVLLDAPERGAMTRLPDDDVVAAAREAMPDAGVAAMTWLTAYDAYYYDRHQARPLPVLRVEYDDPERTWLYLDPQHGVVAMKQERLSRLNRWLYHGLHSLDFPFLYDRRPLWDIVVIVLSAGGIVLSATSLVPAWRRLRRHARAWESGRVAIPRPERRVRLSTAPGVAREGARCAPTAGDGGSEVAPTR